MNDDETQHGSQGMPILSTPEPQDETLFRNGVLQLSLVKMRSEGSREGPM